MADKRWWLLSLLLTLPWFACIPGVKQAESPPVVNKVHRDVAANYCTQCHIQKGEQYQPKTFDSIKACQDCHPPLGHNHPLDMTPKGTVGKLPLYGEKVTCLTCHDPHNRQGYEYLLRQPSRLLCLNCHEDK